MCSGSEAGSYLRLIDFVYHGSEAGSYLRLIDFVYRLELSRTVGTRFPAPPSRTTTRGLETSHSHSHRISRPVTPVTEHSRDQSHQSQNIRDQSQSARDQSQNSHRTFESRKERGPVGVVADGGDALPCAPLEDHHARARLSFSEATSKPYFRRQFSNLTVAQAQSNRHGRPP